MAELWDSTTGRTNPSCRQDIEIGIAKLIDSGLIRAPRQSKSAFRHTIKEICEAADIDKIVEVTERAIEKRGAWLSYIVAGVTGRDDNPSPSDSDNPLGGSEHSWTDGEATPEAPTPTGPANREAAAKDAGAIRQGAEREGDGEQTALSNYCFFNRSLRNHPFLKTVPAWVRNMWDNLIMDAAWKDHEIEWRGRNLLLRRGQWVVSERDLAKEHRQSPRMVHYWLEKLVKQEMIQCVTAYAKPNSSDPWNVAGSVAGNVAGSVAGGTLVTLLNYDKFQPNLNAIVAGCVAGSVAGSVAQQKNVLTEEGIKEGLPTPLPPSPQKITAEKIFEIWESERGPLPMIQARRPQDIKDLVEHINSLTGDPEDQWRELVRRARQCDKSHWRFMSPKFLSTDTNHINQLIAGVYDKPFEERGKKNGGGKTFERAGKGNAEDFGGAHGSAEEQMRKVAALARASAVPKVQ